MRLILFSGLGADKRLFHRLSIPNCELIVPEYSSPEKAEGLPDYAVRMAREVDLQESDIVGGASFGGMVAAEIAARRKVAGLILMGSCLSPKALPWLYRRLGVFSPLVPDWFLRWSRIFRPAVMRRSAPIGSADVDCLLEMMKAAPPAMLRRGIPMILRWPGVDRPACPVLSIHGALDRVIPPDPANTDVLLPKAGHAFTLTHPDETSAAISRFVASLQ